MTIDIIIKSLMCTDLPDPSITLWLPRCRVKLPLDADLRSVLTVKPRIRGGDTDPRSVPRGNFTR